MDYCRFEVDGIHFPCHTGRRITGSGSKCGSHGGFLPLLPLSFHLFRQHNIKNKPMRPSLYPELEFLGSGSDFADDVFAVLRHEPLFEDFGHQEIEVLCQFMHCFAAPRDTVLLDEDQEGDYLLIVLTGEILVSKLSAAGKSVGMAMVGPGAILGEMSLVDGERRFASCITTAPVDFAVMRRSDLNEILIAHPRLANKFLIKMLQIIVARMRDTGLRMVNGDSRPVV